MNRKYIRILITLVLSSCIIAIFFFAILSLRLAMSPREILRNAKQVSEGNIVAEVVERDAEIGEVRLVFYYETDGNLGLAIFQPRWTGYELINGNTTDNWRCSLWSKKDEIARYIAWGVCDEEIEKVWLRNQSQYAKLFSIGDRHFWYALTDMAVSGHEDVVFIS